MTRLRLLALAGFTLALLAVGIGPASAHATLKETTPGAGEIVSVAPGTVRLRFDEPVKTVGQGVRVFGPGGDRVDGGRNTVRDETVTVAIRAEERGTYTVAWRVVSDDGHNLSGSFVFHFGKQTGAVDVTERISAATSAAGGIGRFAAFAAAIIIVGATALALYSRDATVAARLRAVVLTAALAGLAAVALVLVSQAARATGRPLLNGFGATWDLASNTRTGQFGLVRAATFAVVAGLSAWPAGWQRLRAVNVGLGGAAMVAVTLSGHPWSSSVRPVAVVADIAHQGFAGVWIGGLVALVLVLRVAADRVGLVYRFSQLALVCSVGVLVSGSVSAYLNVRSLSVVLTTGYGIMLVAKIGGFAGLCLFGWLNRRRYIPLLAKTLEPLTRSLRVEVLVAASVVAVTAGLVNQPPAANAINKPFETTVLASDASVLVQVTPARVGLNDIHMYFYDKAGVSSFDTDAVEVTAAVGDIPARKLKVTPVTPSHQSVYGASLPRPGEWVFRITALRAGTPRVFTVKVPVK